MTKELRGILFMCLAMLLFTGLDTSAKLVTQDLAPWVAVFFRHAVALLLGFAILLARKGLSGVTTRHPGLQTIRGLLLTGSTFCNFVAMQHLQLAQTAAIFFTIPLLVSALSVPLLGEHVGWRRWLAVIVGFFGVIVIMRPGTTGFHWAMFFSLAAALQGALYNIATRKVGGHDSAETSLFYVALVGSLASIIPASLDWTMPQGTQWLLLFSMGIFGTIGHFLLIEGHRLAPASRLAPFIYSQIIWMTLSGFLVFGDVPDKWTLAGAAIVVASGLYLLQRERIKGRTEAVTAPSD
jgi:drug/metabolite transporter (DMT)-like permease